MDKYRRNLKLVTRHGHVIHEQGQGQVLEYGDGLDERVQINRKVGKVFR